MIPALVIGQARVIVFAQEESDELESRRCVQHVNALGSCKHFLLLARIVLIETSVLETSIHVQWVLQQQLNIISMHMLKPNYSLLMTFAAVKVNWRKHL